MERVKAPLVADERTMLEAWLDFHRATLLQKVTGLDRAQLLRPSCPPSDLTLLGLVRHMADVERGWFREFAGEVVLPLYYDVDLNPEGEFHPPDDVDPDVDLATFRGECDHSRSIVAAIASLDEARLQGEKIYSLRWIMVHMIEEYARHNGHADLLREAIDGATGD